MTRTEIALTLARLGIIPSADVGIKTETEPDGDRVRILVTNKLPPSPPPSTGMASSCQAAWMAWPGSPSGRSHPGTPASMNLHAIHMHGHSFKIVATDGGDIPESAQQPETTVAIGPGQTRDDEFIAIPGDWTLHCHLRHHPMNAMGHDIPHVLGVNQEGVEEKIPAPVPGDMAMGETGMHEHTQHAKPMAGPPHTLPMMGGE